MADALLHSSSVEPRSAGSPDEFVLTLDCPDSPGIVHAVTGVLLDQGFTIAELKQFDDRRAGHLFMRVHVVPATGAGRTRRPCAPRSNRWPSRSACDGSFVRTGSGGGSW